MMDTLPPEGELVKNLPELSRTMGEVAAAASGVGLGHLQYGLRAYRRVTEAVTEEAAHGHFEDPEKMQRTMPYFAKRIFDPIRIHTQTEGRAPEAVGPWAHMFYNEAAQNALPSTAMVDFLGFHVLYDLPFTLKDTQTEDRHKKDYSRKINLILAKVGREILPEYIDLHTPLKRAHAADVGLGMVMTHLIISRNHAWRSFKRLEAIEERELAGKSRLTERFGFRPETAEDVDYELGELAARRMLSTKKTARFILQRAGRVPHHYWQPAILGGPTIANK